MTTQQITKIAQTLGLTVRMEGTELVGRDGAGLTHMSATIVGGKFFGGYTVDFMGHVVSHDTVKGLCAALVAA
jgi:hypothetical protein